MSTSGPSNLIPPSMGVVVQQVDIATNEVVPGEGTANRRPFLNLEGTGRRLALASLTLIVLWTLVILRLGIARFAIYSPGAEIGEEAATALAAFLGTLILTLFPPGEDEMRLRWVAAGFAVLGIGALIFGYLEPLVSVAMPLNTTLYIAITIRVVVGALLLVGLLPEHPPRFSRHVAIGVALIIIAMLTAIFTIHAYLPVLLRITSLQGATRESRSVLQGLTPWHWIISPLSLFLTVGAAMGAVRHFRGTGFGQWLLVALIFLAGSQLQNIFWPSTYTGVVTTANLLRLAFATLIAVGAIVELRRIAEERSLLLAAAREHGRRLEELADLKASFTAMVAHELHSPLAAIRGTSAMLATGELLPDERAEALRTIDSQIDMLAALISDMQTASMVERPEFAVQLRPVRAAILVSEAYAYARTLPGNHPLTFPAPSGEVVLADRERMGQVLRNLLNNAAKYSDPGTAIELTVARRGDCLHFAVRDRGYGIHPDDMTRIFEKFGRGRDRSGRRVSGVGLGLYLSRRIMQVHGTDLSVRSTPGAGSTFSFDLPIEG